MECDRFNPRVGRKKGIKKHSTNRTRLPSLGLYQVAGHNSVTAPPPLHVTAPRSKKDFMIEAFLIGLVLATIPGYWFKKTIWLDGHEFVIRNNLLGIEKVIVDGKVCVSKFSWAGTHKIKIDEFEYEISFFHKPHFMSVGITLHKGSH